MSSGPLSNRIGKLGPRIWSFSLPRILSCPGASAWCRETCYMAKLERAYASMLASYHENFERVEWDARALRDDIINQARRLWDRGRLIAVRIHVDGDFHKAGYIRLWAHIARALPEIPIYAYTRSWRISRLLPALLELSRVPNVRLWASTDPTIDQDPPAGWPTAWIDGDPRATGPVCPEQRGKRADCGECGWCYGSTIRNVRFRIH